MGKVALVTGASSGIGKATCLAFEKAGYQLIRTGRNKSEFGDYATDLSNLLAINRFIDTIKRRFKRIDVLVNVAGIWHGQNEVYAGKNLENFEQKIILDTFMVGTIAPVLLVHGLVDLMPPKSKIINVSGTFENGAKGWIPYYVSKRAIEDLTIGLAQELKRKNIQVNAISPSDCATEAYKKYFPQYLNEAIAPKEVAQFCLKLCRDDRTTGKVFVLKKAKHPFESFHY